MSAWKEQYLELRNTGMLEATALKALQVSRRALREARVDDPDFAEKEYEAEQNRIDELEAEAITRAMSGEPVYNKDGIECGVKKSDTLLMFLLKGNRREKYGDKSEIKTDSDLNITLRDIASENNVDLQTAKRMALKAATAPVINITYGEF